MCVLLGTNYYRGQSGDEVITRDNLNPLVLACVGLCWLVFAGVAWWWMVLIGVGEYGMVLTHSPLSQPLLYHGCYFITLLHFMAFVPR